MKKTNKYLILPIFILLINLFFWPAVNAQERIQSDNYRIIFPNLNSGAGIPTSSNYQLNSTLGQTAPGLFSSTGFRVKAGFQYINSIIPFSFSISHIQINFGTLVPQTPSASASTISISAGGAGGYVVKAQENNTLKTEDNTNEIIDTLCNSTCSETTAGIWTSSTRYGFGFNMTGDDIPTDFVNSTYFRQFANKALGENPQIIMSSNNVGRSRTATITYRVNVSGIQPAGTYRNIVNFTATPAY